VGRQAPVKAIFNVAQYALVGATSLAVYRVLGGVALLAKLEFNWVAYTCAFAAFVLLNGLLVCTAVSLAEGKAFASTWLAHARSAIAYDVLSIPLPYLFAIVYVHWGPMGAMALGLPLLAARQLYKTNWQLEKVNQELLQL